MSNQNPDFTNPAYNPANPPFEGESGQAGQAPQQGQPGQAPQYGQAGQYGQAPQYGQPGPYGQAPQYGQPGQYPATGSRYGTQPYGVDGRYGTVPEPRGFRTLLTLTLVSAALWVLSSLPAMFTMDDMMDVVMRDAASQPGVTAEDMEMVSSFMRTAGITSIVISLIIGLGLYALVYFNLRGVKNWARILGIVFAILGALAIFSGIGFLFSGSTMLILSGALTLAYAVVNIIWVITAFRSDVAEWFRQGRPAAA